MIVPRHERDGLETPGGGRKTWRVVVRQRCLSLDPGATPVHARTEAP